MAEAKKTPQKLNEKKAQHQHHHFEIVNSRQSKDIYLGLCGYVGCGMRTINKIIEEDIQRMGV